MPRSDSGEGFVKGIFTLAILALLVFVGVKAVPVYFDNYQLADYIRDRAIRASVERTAPDIIQNEVVRYAQNLGLPISRDNVRVTSGDLTVKIQIDYTVPVDLKFYTWNLHFAPSAENRAF